MRSSRRTWQSFEEMRKAAEEGDEQAQCYLGVCYQTGQGVPQDYDEAVKWIRRGAEGGDSVSPRSSWKICCIRPRESIQQVTPLLQQRRSGKPFSIARKPAALACCHCSAPSPNQPSFVRFTGKSVSSSTESDRKSVV